LYNYWQGVIGLALTFISQTRIAHGRGGSMKIRMDYWGNTGQRLRTSTKSHRRKFQL